MKILSIMLAINMLFTSCSGWIRINYPQVTLSFVGDCTISSMKGKCSEGCFNWYAENHEPEYFLRNVTDIFQNDDFTIVNCETVLTDNPLTERNKGSDTAFWFKGPAKNAEIFSVAGVELAGLANNHVNDYGKDGLADTVAALEAVGVTAMEENKPVYVEKNGITIGILACGMWYSGSEKTIIPILEKMVESSDVQVIYPHGGAEGVRTVEQWRRDAYHKLIDKGADIIVGTHAHLLQPLEEYNGGVIVYGLGNFCFGGNNYPENRTAIYQCTIKKTSSGFTYSSDIIPCYVYTGSSNNWQPALVPETDPVYSKIKDYMAWKISSPV